MQERRLVVTLSIGKAWERVAAVSHPTFRAYAERIGADFKIIDRRRISSAEHVHWEKLQLHRLLAPYNRALYIDSDALVHPSAPDVFEQVPPGTFAAWEEGALFDRSGDVEGVTRFYGLSTLDAKRFFNAGVFVVDRAHRGIFQTPKEFYRGANPEQAYLNFITADLPRFGLDKTWNLFPRLRAPGDSYLILHFAGRSGNLDALAAEMRAEVATWN